MEYSCATWSNISVESSNKLQNIQNRAARLVTGAMRLTSIQTLHRELGWPLLETRRKYFRLAFVHRATLGELPQYLQTNLPEKNHAHNTRNKQLKTFTYKTLKFGNSLLPRAVREYNKLSDTYRKKVTSATFKKKMKQLLFKWDSPPPYYREGSGKTCAMHCQIRMGFSRLNAHIFKNLGKGDSNCQHCETPETALHYLLDCPTYEACRIRLFQDIKESISETNLAFDTLPNREKHHLLLHGSSNLSNRENGLIFQAVQQFIFTSGRFVATSVSCLNPH